MNSLLPLVGVFTVLLAGCATPFQGMKFRAQSPPIADAYKKLVLALQVDGYTMAEVDPRMFSLQTSWRMLKEKEKSEADLKLRETVLESKIEVRLVKRGSMYDVFLVPTLRYGAGGAPRDVVADVRHPLWEKWRAVLTALLQREAKEED